jgi:hypothetical protein
MVCEFPSRDYILTNKQTRASADEKDQVKHNSAATTHSAYFTVTNTKIITRRISLIPLQLPLSPMRLFAIGIEYSFNAMVQSP